MNGRTLLTSAALCVASLSLGQAQPLDRFQVGSPSVGGNSPTNVNQWPESGRENPGKARDAVSTNKSLSFGELNPGYIFTLSSDTATARGMSLTKANDATAQNSITFSLYDSNRAVANTTPGTNYLLTSFRSTSTTAPLVNFANTTAVFSTYLLIFPTVKDTYLSARVPDR